MSNILSLRPNLKPKMLSLWDADVISFPIREKPCEPPPKSLPMKSLPVRPKKHRKPRKPLEYCSGFNYHPRLNIWRYNQATIDPTTLRATSYGWWEMLKSIEGLLVLNSYRYSVTTAKHQSRLRGWLTENGYTWIEIECPRGLQELKSGLNYYVNKIAELTREITKPRTRAKKNEERRDKINGYERQMELIYLLLERSNKRTLNEPHRR